MNVLFWATWLAGAVFALYIVVGMLSVALGRVKSIEDWVGGFRSARASPTAVFVEALINLLGTVIGLAVFFPPSPQTLHLIWIVVVVSGVSKPLATLATGNLRRPMDKSAVLGGLVMLLIGVGGTAAQIALVNRGSAWIVFQAGIVPLPFALVTAALALAGLVWMMRGVLE